jgi:hypothetical protein
MEKFEDKIIDLVDVISEADAGRSGESDPAPGAPPLKGFPKESETADLESLVRKEVERLIRVMIDDNIQKMIREILEKEVEKAVAREIETLKRT